MSFFFAFPALKKRNKKINPKNIKKNKYKSCQHNHKCQHEFMGANKYIKNKIDELQIKCIYSRFGCEFNSKVSEIERHQENCQFKSNPKENEEILPEETNEIFKNTFKACPISQIDCDLGCKQSLEHLKAYFLIIFFLLKLTFNIY